MVRPILLKRYHWKRENGSIIAQIYFKTEEIMAGLKKNIIFYILLFIDFYIIPRFIKDTGSAVIVMLMIIPLICLITSVFYGIRNGFDFWYILIAAIMFTPSIFMFYNSSAWVYVVGYAVIALLGNLIALPLRKNKSVI